MMKNNKYILGLDISSTQCGWALMNRDKKLIDYGTFKCTGSHLSKRLMSLKQNLISLKFPQPYDDVVVYCEKPIEGGFVSGLKCCWGAHGVVIGSISAHTEFITPRKWREIVFGDNYHSNQKREALKALSLKYVKDHYDVETKNDDIADAICIARYGSILE